MGCGCENKKTNSVRTYRNKNRHVTKINFNKPSKSKDQLRKELIARMAKLANQN